MASLSLEDAFVPKLRQYEICIPPASEMIINPFRSKCYVNLIVGFASYHQYFGVRGMSVRREMWQLGLLF